MCKPLLHLQCIPLATAAFSFTHPNMSDRKDISRVNSSITTTSRVDDASETSTFRPHDCSHHVYRRFSFRSRDARDDERGFHVPQSPPDSAANTTRLEQYSTCPAHAKASGMTYASIPPPPTIPTYGLVRSHVRSPLTMQEESPEQP